MAGKNTELLQPLVQGQKLSHTCYKEQLGSYLGVINIVDIANPQCECIIEHINLTPLQLVTYLNNRNSSRIFEDNFNTQLRASTKQQLFDACSKQLNNDQAAMKVHETKALQNQEFFIKSGLSQEESMACAFAIAFYTGCQSEHVNRAASIVARKGNGTVSQATQVEALPILYFMTKGLSKIPFYWGPAVRAVQLTLAEQNEYAPGQIVTWVQFSSSKKGTTPAESFQARNTLFYLHSATGRSIKGFSNYPNEDEVLFLPHSTFLVLRKYQSEGKLCVHMRQIEVGLSPLCIMWVDDQIFDENWENKRHMEFGAAKGLSENIHFIPKRCTSDAISFLKSAFGRRLKGSVNFRIISDMNRTNENPSNNAGARLLKSVRELGFNNKFMIFTSDRDKAREMVNCVAGQGAQCEITTSTTDLKKFMEMKN